MRNWTASLASRFSSRTAFMAYWMQSLTPLLSKYARCCASMDSTKHWKPHGGTFASIFRMLSASNKRFSGTYFVETLYAMCRFFGRREDAPIRFDPPFKDRSAPHHHAFLVPHESFSPCDLDGTPAGKTIFFARYHLPAHLLRLWGRFIDINFDALMQKTRAGVEGFVASTKLRKAPAAAWLRRCR